MRYEISSVALLAAVALAQADNGAAGVCPQGAAVFSTFCCMGSLVGPSAHASTDAAGQLTETFSNLPSLSSAHVPVPVTTGTGTTDYGSLQAAMATMSGGASPLKKRDLPDMLNNILHLKRAASTISLASGVSCVGSITPMAAAGAQPTATGTGTTASGESAPTLAPSTSAPTSVLTAVSSGARNATMSTAASGAGVVTSTSVDMVTGASATPSHPSSASSSGALATKSSGAGQAPFAARPTAQAVLALFAGVAARMVL